MTRTRAGGFRPVAVIIAAPRRFDAGQRPNGASNSRAIAGTDLPPSLYQTGVQFMAPRRARPRHRGIALARQRYCGEIAGETRLVTVAQLLKLGGDLRRIVRQNADDDASISAGIEHGLKMRGDSFLQPLPRLARRGGGSFHPVQNALHALFVDREQQRLLAGDVEVNRAGRHGGGGGEVAHAGGVKAAVGKLRARRRRAGPASGWVDVLRCLQSPAPLKRSTNRLFSVK